jgi:preprotein translocase subunit Sec61beta
MSCAVLFLMRARLGEMRAAAAAGVFAVLMFYTRLNHLLLAGFLLASLLPTRTPAAVRELLPAIRRTRIGPALAYSAAIVVGVILFAAHTWWYAGHFSIVYGTSFTDQQTGLRVTTIASPDVWMKIGEAFAAQLSMREPAAIDPRSALVIAGALLSVLALLQVRHARRLPASLALLTVGTIAGSFVAHTHEYPGRMAVHVVPFAVGMSACAASQLLHAWKRRGDQAVARTPSLAM